MSELDRPIPPEIFNDELYHLLKEIASKNDVRYILEIGSSSGEGSTSAIVSGIRSNPNNPSLFCLEVSKVRFEGLKKRYLNEPNVHCFNLSSVLLKDFPTEQTVTDFYMTTKSVLNNYPLETVLGWLAQDKDYITTHEIRGGGIRLIKEQFNINYFDMVLIDGSEFTGEAELNEVYGARYVVLDDIRGFKNYANFQRLSRDPHYHLMHCNPNLRNGYAIFKRDRYMSIALKVEAIEGHLMPGQERYLFEKVESLPHDAVIVEIGSYKGRSTVAMAYACKDTKRKIYCIDTWRGNDTDFKADDFYNDWLNNIQSNGLGQYVTPLRGNSKEVIEILRDEAIRVDFAFIDGSHQFIDVLNDFESLYPLMKDQGQIAFHDVIYTWRGPFECWHSIAKHVLTNHEYCGSIATGVANKKQRLPTEPLTVHFFTIVINGMPFIQFHIDALNRLPFKWHWHIIEGVAAHRHDTAWSLQFGGKISDEIHKEGLSIDGTSEYIDELKRQYPENITVYRKPKGEFWDGKIEMVNAPLKDISEECLLFQIDVDELWTVSQLCAVEAMFRMDPEKTAAYYYCHFFVGKNLIVTSKDTYGNNSSYEWLRTWRYKPGDLWVSHEPPILVRKTEAGDLDVARINPFTHYETRDRGLIFQHFAYVTKEQLKFKESYYGYTGALDKWMRLNECSQLPVFLKEYFDWVRDFAVVFTTHNRKITPIANSKNDEHWRFNHFAEIHYPILENETRRILWLSTDSIGDNLLRMPSLGPLKGKFKEASITVLCQKHIAELYEPCPYINDIVTFHRNEAYKSSEYVKSLVSKLTGFDLIINPIYSSDELTMCIFLGVGARYRVGFKCDTSNIEKTKLMFYQAFYDEIITVKHPSEIEKNKDLLDFFGIKDLEPTIEIWLTGQDVAFAKEFFSQNRLSPDHTIALFAGAQFDVRLYNYYGKALSKVKNIKDFAIIALGDQMDFQINEQNLKDSGATYFNLSGKLTLRQSAAILSKCRLAVGTETGLAHMACFLEVPNVIILGGGHFGRFMPYSPLTSVVCNNLDCFGCNWQCKYGDLRCIREINPDILSRAINDALYRPNQRAAAYMQSIGPDGLNILEIPYSRLQKMIRQSPIL